MKPTLVIGLGNPLAGDDAVGCHVAESLGRDVRLPPGVEVLCGGTDLLRCLPAMQGREHIVLVDAALDDAPGGTIQVHRDCLTGLDDHQPHAHHLSPVQTMDLIRRHAPEIGATRTTLVAVPVPAVHIGLGLSSLVAARLPAIVDAVLQELP